MTGKGLRTIWATLLAIVMVASACGNSPSTGGQSNSGWKNLRGQTVVVYTYGGSYLDGFTKTVFEPFEKATGAKVVTDGTCCTKLATAVQAGQYAGDIYIGDDRGTALNNAAQGYLLPHNALVQLEQQYGMPAELQSAYVLPVDIVTYVMAGASPTGPMPQSWQDFWDVQKFPGTRGLPDQVQPILEAALLADGVSPNLLYPLDVKRAFASLDKLRKSTRVIWLQSGAQQQQFLANGEVAYEMAFSNRMYQLVTGGTKIGLTFNQGLQETTVAALIKGSKNVDGGIELLKFMMSPKIQADYGAATGLSPMYAEAANLIPADRRDLLPSSPKNMAVQIPVSDAYWQLHYAELTKQFVAWKTSQ